LLLTSIGWPGSSARGKSSPRSIIRKIAAIYGLERSGATTALVMELVEGPTLADRITRGPIPIDEALPIAKQIAEALEAAHEHGIIHRDLKPANVKITDDGTVKVLDFGLAKPTGDHGSRSGANVADSPTLTTPAATALGLILGTAAYMAPEQAKGQRVDKRVDVWAFGCVLYEMLSGRRAFEGDDVSETLASVLKTGPDWRALPADLPGPIRLLIERSLVKDRRRRVGDISTALLS
jgi:eukaryotic-like serine/threonine-protein kinase